MRMRRRRVEHTPGETGVRVVLVVEQLRRRVPGGIGTYAHGLLSGLRAVAGDAELSLYASRAPGTADPLDAYGRPVLTSRLPGPVLTRLWDRGLVHAPSGFDVVHALSLAAPPPRRSTEVVTVHDLAWRVRPEDFPARGRRWHEAAFRRVVGRGAHLVTPSQSVATDVLDAGAPAGSVSVIAHGSDHLPAPDTKAAAALLARLGIESQFLLSVGTIEPRKNLRRVVDAYHQARASLPEPWPLVIVGPTGWGHAPADRSQADGVAFTGPVAPGTLAALYGEARLLVYAPLVEGFGLPPVEAMRLGTPVVASSVPGVGEAAFTVDPESVDDMAQGIVGVATDEALRARLVSAGGLHTRSLTWESTARAHLALWRSLS
jgi:glycosyltransferase involved in cell wall biosynthesis